MFMHVLSIRASDQEHIFPGELFWSCLGLLAGPNVRQVMSSYVFDAHDQGPPSQPVHSATGGRGAMAAMAGKRKERLL